jgi:hypothetical protein
MHNLHCPTCNLRLIERAGRFEVLGEVLGTPKARKYVGSGEYVCPAGHQLPEADALYAYRDRQGHPPESSFNEVPWPHR